MYLYTKSQNSPHKHSLQTAFFGIFMKIHVNVKFPQSAVELIVPLVK